MDAHEYGLVVGPRALDECHVLEAVALLAEGDVAEVAVGRGQVHLGCCLHELRPGGGVAGAGRLVLEAVGYEVAYGDDAYAVALCHLAQLGHSGHGAVGVEYLYECCCGLQPGQACEVCAGLGVAGAAQHAPVLGVEGVDVARAAEVGGLGRGVGQVAYGGGAVGGADAGGAALELIDGDGEWRAEHGGVVLHLVGQLQLHGAADGDGCAQDAAPLAEHEVDLLGGDHLGGGDEVALILAVLVIDDDDELALAEVLDGGRDGG